MGIHWGMRKAFPRFFCFSFLIFFTSTLNAHGKQPDIDCVPALQDAIVDQEARELWRHVAAKDDAKTAKVEPVSYPLARALDFYARRGAVVLTGVLSVFGSGFLGAYLVEGVDSKLAQNVVPNAFMFISTTVFIKILSPLLGKAEAWTKYNALRNWNPSENDQWGTMGATIPDTHLEVIHLTTLQLLALNKILEDAKISLQERNFPETADVLVDALITSFHLFRGLHTDDTSILVAAKRKILKNLRPEDVMPIRDEVRKALDRRADEIRRYFKDRRVAFLEFTEETLSMWLEGK